MKIFLIEFPTIIFILSIFVSCAPQKDVSNITVFVNGKSPYSVDNSPFKLRNKQITKLLNKKEYEQARQIIIASLRSYPNDVFLHYHLGLSYMRQKLYAEAVPQFEKVLTLSKSHKAALFNLASIRQQQNNLESARKLYEKLLTIYPDDPDTHYNLALVYDKLFKREKAIYHYRKCIPFFKNDRIKRKYVKAIQKRIGDLELLGR